MEDTQISNVKKPSAEKKLAPNVGRKLCPNYHFQRLAASIVIRSESGAPITTPIFLAGNLGSTCWLLNINILPNNSLFVYLSRALS